MFIDSAKIFVKAGDGGNGIVSFRREKYVAAGGPDGGDGGKGGDIVFVVDGSIRTLADFKYKRRYKAENGDDGGAANRTGKSGRDLVIKVPPGTMIKDEESGLMIADLTKEGQTAVVARGGKGGSGNQRFATPTRQVPTFAKSGDPGEERWILVELKLLADVGLIGYPNVGKSTLLSVVSAADPKIADYHFTTLEPNLGVVRLDQDTSFVIADIPGLIEGAHEGVGLGHEFLKHVERTKLLVHVVDAASVEGRDPLEDFEVINRELKEYSPRLAEKPQVVAANKIDVLSDMSRFEAFKNKLESLNYKVFPISAAANRGVRELMYYAAGMLDQIEEPVPEDAAGGEVVYSAREEEPFTIRKEGDIYVVEGTWVKKIVGSTNFDSYDSLQYFQRAIRRRGIVDALEDMGIHEGDTVKMYDLEFEYIR